MPAARSGEVYRSEVEERFRLSVLEDGHWRPVAYEGVFGPESRWLAAAPTSSPIELMIRLLEAMTPPYRVELEVLEPEGLAAEEGQVFTVPGDFSREALSLWLRSQAEGLESDARLAVLVHGSAGERIVYDEHNRLLMNGPVEGFEQLLLAAGLLPGDPSVPFPHAHHYRDELTPVLAGLLSKCGSTSVPQSWNG